MEPTSEDLHPKSGARFRFEKAGEGSYSVEVFLPESQWTARYELEGNSLEPEPKLGEGDAWTVDEVRKLGRVLRRDGKARLVRWRAGPGG